VIAGQDFFSSLGKIKILSIVDEDVIICWHY